MAPKPGQSSGGTGNNLIDNILKQLENLTPEQLATIGPFIELLAGVGYGAQTSYPPRAAIDERFAADFGAQPGEAYLYTGAGIVDANGMILTQKDQFGKDILDMQGKPSLVQYDPIPDGSREYFNYLQNNPDQLDYILSLLEQKGYETGTVQQNVSAFQKVMTLAKDVGVSFDVMLRNIQMYQADSAPSSNEVLPRVSSPQDLAAVANQTALRTIGREMTEEETNRFVQAYQGMERGQYAQMSDPASTQVVSAPAADVAAQNFITQQAPQEVNAYDAMTSVGWLVNGIRSIV